MAAKNTTTLYIELNKVTKRKAEYRLKLLGITPKSAIEMLYTNIIVNEKIPHELEGENNMSEKNTEQLNIRIDIDLKKQAEARLKVLGISPSSAIQMLYAQIVMTNSFPLDLTIPNSINIEDLTPSNNALEDDYDNEDTSSNNKTTVVSSSKDSIYRPYPNVKPKKKE